ncbi:membrane protein insertion efficiency factor YidD [Merismopedia glauca]|uniref:Membrane protein insertion efficiency factor YidD n=1 Tax=Merismopedia glauca CCAP 1448/3 TaxID=1296344 RepID=A0A2T1C2K3_9CYAN|nr:membrane protein insertion efficiency factor YidD [Merismopedia glauca]PSB02408.1 membrane protein insertion efficiency factor YidD [Merismopedia glauca CCAP 1448/3]
MPTYWLDVGMRQMALASISGYQRYLSPHKGFKCAHRVLNGGKSCSEYVKQVITQEGLIAAIPASRQRFAACHAANQILQARVMRSQVEEEETRKRRNSSASCSNNPYDRSCLVSDCIPTSYDCNAVDCGSGLDCAIPDCGDCASGLDCGTLDCGGLDCGSADCSGCGSCSW